MTAICQIREGVPEAVRGVEWVCFGSTTFGAFLPLYTNVPAMPAYLSKVTLDASTENFYWASRLLEALADPHFGSTVQLIERYHRALAAESRRILAEYDRKFAETGDPALLREANDKLAALAKKETTDALNKVLRAASEKMKNGYNRADN